MLIFRSNFLIEVGDIVPGIVRGFAAGGKGQCDQPYTVVQHLEIEVGRLKQAWGLGSGRFVQPPSRTRTRVRVRTYTRVYIAAQIPIYFKSQLDRLGGWVKPYLKRLSAVQPFDQPFHSWTSLGGSMANGGMREKMPTMAAYIDSLRAAFGDEYINDIMRRALRGEPVFHATENGHEVGTPVLAVGRSLVRFDAKTDKTEVYEIQPGEPMRDVYTRIADSERGKLR